MYIQNMYSLISLVQNIDIYKKKKKKKKKTEFEKK